MKIFMPPIIGPHSTPIKDAISRIGLETTIDPEDCDYAYFGKNNYHRMYSILPENIKNSVNLDLTLKDKLPLLCEAAGINFIESEIITSSDTISNFPENNVFLKPIEGAASSTRFTFVYKTFTSKTELLSKIQEECPSFFDLDEDENSIAKQYIVQKAFLTGPDGLLDQYFSGAYVNGSSQLLTEGIGSTKIKFNQLNDVDDFTYPLRNLRKYYLRNMEDQTDRFNIFSQLQQLVQYYSIKNTPISTQWLVDEDGQSFLIDLSYNYQRGLYCTSLVNTEKFVSKMKYVYDISQTDESPMTGWNGQTDIVLSESFDMSKKSDIIQYAESLGFVVTKSWAIGTHETSKSIPMSFLGTSEQDCLSRLDLLENYINSI